MNTENERAGLFVAIGFIGVAAILLSYEANKQRKKNKKTLSGLSVEDVKKGDYLLLTTGGERAKVRITSTRDKYGRIEIEGVTNHKGKKHIVAVLKSDFENGDVRKISKGTKVNQIFKP